MTVPSCVRCGQLLLPEIVRQLGDGRRCPFCGADLKLDAKVDVPKAPPARRPPPPAPPARAKPSPAAPTRHGGSPARLQPAVSSAVAIAVVPPPAPRASTAFAPALARAPQPDTAPTLSSVPAPRPHEAEPVPAQPFHLAPLPSDAAPPWLAARRRRAWLAVPAVLAVIVTVGLVAGRRPTAITHGASVPGPSAVPPRAAVPPTVSPLPPESPGDRKDPENIRPSTAASPPTTRHPKEGGRAPAAQRTRHPKTRRLAHATRSKHKRIVAIESAASPTGAGDERSARASYERGNQRLLTGDTAAAISAYQEAVRSAPSSPSGYRGLGLAYEKEGKNAEAMRAFRRYLELAPSSGDRDLVAHRLRHLLRSSGAPGR